MSKFNRRNVSFTGRPCLERMRAIRAHLVSGKPFTTATIACKLETCRKTIHRDIDFMRDRLGYELTFNYKTNFWTGHAPADPIL